MLNLGEVRMLRKVSALAVMAGLTVFAFQNCGQVAFKNQDLNGMLAVKNTNDPTTHGSITEPELPTTPPHPPTLPETYEQGDEHFICVLEGEGQSVRLGYADKKLAEKTGALDDVCMSEYACKQIVSQAFKVKMPKREGFCVQQAPNSVRFSDAQLDAMINEILKK